MQEHSHKHEVYWYTLKKPLVKKIDRDRETDVIVIGGGVAGLSTAHRLIQSGKRVILIEKEFCGGGASGKSSGFICQDAELELSDLIEHWGEENAKKLWEFVGSGMESIRRTIEQNGIVCDFQLQDYLFLANDKRGTEKIARERNGREVLGYKSTLHTKETLTEVIGSSRYGGGLRYPGTFGINAYLFSQALKEILERAGVEIYEQSKVVSIEGSDVVVETVSNDERATFRVRGSKVVLCADRFIPDLKYLKNNIYHVQTYLSISRPLSEEQTKKLFPQGGVMCADSDMIYQYFRVTGDRRLLIGGGDILGTYRKNPNTKPEHFLRKIKKYISATFPGVPIEIEYVWPGMLGVSKDLLPIAGVDRENSNLYFVGASTGLAWAAALGNYIGEKIIDGTNHYDMFFDPYRSFPLDPMVSYGQRIVGNPPAFAVSHAYVKYLR